MSPPFVVDLDQQRKAWATLTARFALGGFALNRRAGGGFQVDRSGFSVDLPDMTAVMQFAEQAGIDTE